MPSVIIHGSRVYQYRRKNKWKESWLSLDQNGTLNWKRKDAYLPLSSVRLIDILGMITIGDAWYETKKKHESNAAKPFFIFIPIRPGRPAVKFAFFHGPDLELWLAAFATAINRKQVYSSIKDHNITRVADREGLAEEAVGDLLNYADLVSLYKTIWKEFLDVVKNRKNDTDFIEEVIEHRDTYPASIIDHTAESATVDTSIKASTVVSNPKEDRNRKENGHAHVQADGSRGGTVIVDGAPQQNGRVKIMAAEPQAKVLPTDKNVLQHDPAINGRDTKIDNIKTTVTLEKSDSGLSLDSGQLATKYGKARLEFIGWEELRKLVCAKDPDLFITVIHIDHYAHQCRGTEDCVMRL